MSIRTICRWKNRGLNRTSAMAQAESTDSRLYFARHQRRLLHRRQGYRRHIAGGNSHIFRRREWRNLQEQRRGYQFSVDAEGIATCLPSELAQQRHRHFRRQDCAFPCSECRWSTRQCSDIIHAPWLDIALPGTSRRQGVPKYPHASWGATASFRGSFRLEVTSGEVHRGDSAEPADSACVIMGRGTVG